MDELQHGPRAAAAEDRMAKAAGSEGHPTRREFLSGALAISGLALSGILDVEAAAATAAPAAAAAAPPAAAPRQIGEIVSRNGRLRGVITIKSGQRTLPGFNRPSLIRYLEGKDGQAPTVWPAPGETAALPGPTLRARVGDQVELTFLNHVNLADFGTSIDRVERGLDGGCERVVNASTVPATELYPALAKDAPPNCFHGSSTSNLHFHGTHVTPDGLGDNVLLQLRPNPQVTEDSVRDDFELIFRAGPPDEWCDLPRSWRNRQLALLGEYDRTAPWQGVNGALPPERRLLPPTEDLIRRGMWPQYQIGAYPYCFRLTEYTPNAQGRPRYAMGQAPGTHWYHAHKHGSTAINVYNGMAGAFIIEGEYDDTLKRTYPNLVQQVLVVQNYGEAPPLMRGGPGTTQKLWVNGEENPTITMRPGEIQLWRFVNASVRAVTTLLGFTPAGGATGPGPEMRQTAQDGVQFRYENFDAQPRLKPLTVADPSTAPAGRANNFATGNRVDLLVKAPASGSWAFQVYDTTGGLREPTATLVTLTVDASQPAADMQFPTREQYPAFPTFLEDIPEDRIHIRRTLDFGWKDNRPRPGLDNGAPQFTINAEQFEGDRYDQTMVLGDVEEWTLTNSTSQIAHPFHIHVNPFQVVEIYDPNSSQDPYAPSSNYIWQDVIAIPPAKFENDVLVERGRVRIRHRFEDFTGSFVLHCHMLAHEDRGMMQLLRVISGRSYVPHH